MAERRKYSTVWQRQPLKVPDKWGEDERRFVMELEQVLDDIGRTDEELIEWKGAVPNKIRHASLMLVDFAYRQKSPVDTLNWSEVPLTYEHLIKSFVRLADKKVYNEDPFVPSSSDI